MRRIGHCINPILETIREQAYRLENLSALVYSYVPDFLKAHCKVGSFNKGCLVLVVEDAVWAAQLRYSIPELRDQLRNEGKIPQLMSIKISILKSSQSPAIKVKKKNTLSSAACNMIKESAEDVSYGPLKQALLKLADHPMQCLIVSAEYKIS